MLKEQGRPVWLQCKGGLREGSGVSLRLVKGYEQWTGSGNILRTREQIASGWRGMESKVTPRISGLHALCVAAPSLSGEYQEYQRSGLFGFGV